MGKSAMNGGKVRYQLFLPTDAAQRFEQLASNGKASKSAILGAAVSAYIDRRGASEAEERFGIRLDRLSRQLERIERDSEISLESLALFVRYMLAVNAPLPEDDEEMRAIGRERFAVFVTRVGQAVAGGRRTFEPETQS